MKLTARITLITLFVPALFISNMSIATDAPKHQHGSHVSQMDKLSPDLRALLSKEMKALEIGMTSIIPAYIAGNWAEIESTAKKMKNSYILKQSMTKQQIKELHSKLPRGFIKKDKRFHYLAGMLEHAAQHQKPELVNFYFSEMNEACLECHRQFATHRFPALKQKKKKGHSH